MSPTGVLTGRAPELVSSHQTVFGSHPVVLDISALAPTSYGDYQDVLPSLQGMFPLQKKARTPEEVDDKHPALRRKIHDRQREWDIGTYCKIPFVVCAKPAT